VLQPGDQIDIWVVDKRLGTGGMGSVYRCHNRTAKRILAAIKVLESAVRTSPEAEARFVREAEILFQLDHPNIVKVRNIRMEADPPYLEMEFVEGIPLEDQLQQGPMPVDRVIDLMEQTTNAVTYLHAKGIRHRDIKPANLLVNDQGRLKLVDFGLAMEANASRITQQGMAFGTVSYAPPEWIQPDTLDPELWDVYAIGVVAYELLTGKLAFPASGQGSARQQAMQIIVGKQNHPPLDPGDDFPAGLRELIADATQSDPAKRTQSAKAMWQRLQQLDNQGRKAGVTLAPADIDVQAMQKHSGADRPRRPRVLQDELVSEGDGYVPTAPPPPTRQAGADAPTVPDGRAGPRTAPMANAASGRTAMFVGLALVVVLVMGLAGIGAGRLLADGDDAPALRPVEVLVLGVPKETRVRVKLDDGSGSRTGIASGAITKFEAVQTGEVQVGWVIGEDCPLMECPGQQCPVWCASGTSAHAVEPGDGVATLRINVDPPEPVRVAFTTALDAFDTATLGGTAGAVEDGALVFETYPGVYELVVTLGDCPPEVVGCLERSDCPAGCQSTRRDVQVPVGGRATPTELGLAAVKVAPAPTDRPRPAGDGTTGLVTNRQFARFLQDRPEFQKTGDRAASQAFYLSGWDGATPPPGKQGEAVTNINGLAAATYCKWARRSLPKTTDAPTQPRTQMEYRVGDGGRFVVLTEDGSPIPANDPKEANSFATFRCTD
jgi:hypothetical protein